MKKLRQNARFSDKQLFEFVSQLFQVLSLPKQKANVVARILVEADLLGHVTHGWNEGYHMDPKNDPDIFL